jgi:hypothetical protein
MLRFFTLLPAELADLISDTDHHDFLEDAVAGAPFLVFVVADKWVRDADQVRGSPSLDLARLHGCARLQDQYIAGQAI